MAPLIRILAIHIAQLAIRARLETVTAPFLVATAPARLAWLGPLVDHHHGIGPLPVIHVAVGCYLSKWMDK